MKKPLLLLLTLTGIASAQEPPYDVFSEANPPYFRIRYEASSRPGELGLPVNYTLWIPPGIETLRGVVVHQHGCGEGSCKSGLTGAFDLHWQALARKHGSALLAPSYEQPQEADCQLWCDPRKGSDTVFQKSLLDLGNASGHPELTTVPWALWGHSGGANWVGIMTLLHPERVAAAWLRSGVPLLIPRPERPSAQTVQIPDEPIAVPMMLNPGTGEGVTVKEGRFAGVWPAVERFFRAVRSKGGLIGVAVDPLTGHECGNQRYLAIPWLNACLNARLPEAPGKPLQPMPTDKAWLAPLLGNKAVPEPAFPGYKAESIWLPDEGIARAWMHYIEDTVIPDTTPPPAPKSVQVQHREITWEADADLESGIAHFIIERDGRQIATVPDEPSNPYGRHLFQGLQYSDTPVQPLVEMRFIDTDAKPDGSHSYRVIAVNTVGLKSE